MVILILSSVTISLIQQNTSLRGAGSVYSHFPYDVVFSGNTALRVVPLLRFCVETVNVHDDSLTQYAGIPRSDLILMIIFDSSQRACPALFRIRGLIYDFFITHYLIALTSPMATQTDIPSDLTDDDKAVLLQSLDAVLNSGILYALLHGEEQRSVSQHVGAD